LRLLEPFMRYIVVTRSVLTNAVDGQPGNIMPSPTMSDGEDMKI